MWGYKWTPEDAEEPEQKIVSPYDVYAFAWGEKEPVLKFDDTESVDGDEVE